MAAAGTVAGLILSDLPLYEYPPVVRLVCVVEAKLPTLPPVAVWPCCWPCCCCAWASGLTPLTEATGALVVLVVRLSELVLQALTPTQSAPGVLVARAGVAIRARDRAMMIFFMVAYSEGCRFVAAMSE